MHHLFRMWLEMSLTTHMDSRNTPVRCRARSLACPITLVRYSLLGLGSLGPIVGPEHLVITLPEGMMESQNSRIFHKPLNVIDNNSIHMCWLHFILNQTPSRYVV